MKRICGIVLALILVLSLVPMAAMPSVSAAEKETILIAGSDFQVSGNNTSRIQQILNILEIHGITKADRAFFVGDYTLNQMETNTSQYGIQVLKDTFRPLVGDNMIFVQGNHDHEDTVGLSPAGANDPADHSYGAFVIKEDQYREWGNNRKDTEEMVGTLRAYLQQKYDEGWNVPIFVLCHIPLHWSNRTQRDGSGTDADLIFDALNEYAEKGMNIFYLYGHNHSGGYDDFMGGGAVYLKKGDQIEVCQGNKWEHETRTLKFTYMNAGFIGYYSTDQEETDAAVTMSVFRIKGNEVIVTRYDGELNLNTGKYGIHNLKSKGVWNDTFYETYKFHAEVNELEYASSRKVTATDDVYVETPMPSFTTTAPTSSSKPYFTSTATQITGATVTKTQTTTETDQITVTTVQTTEATSATTATNVSDAVVQDTTMMTEASTTMPSDSATMESTTETETTPTESESASIPVTTQTPETAPTEEQIENTITPSTPWILTPWGIALLVVGGVLIVAIPFGIVLFLMLRKNKKQ